MRSGLVLFTNLYELTMIQAYSEEGMTEDAARLPDHVRAITHAERPYPVKISRGLVS